MPAWRCGAAAAEVGEAKVVDEDHHDVRALARMVVGHDGVDSAMCARSPLRRGSYCFMVVSNLLFAEPFTPPGFWH